MTKQWRLIQSEPLNGAMNMAIDEAVLEFVGKKVSPPTLRLYAWNPPCLSLGYAQPYSDVDEQALTALQWDVVRRPTGGRAILHTDEITYAIIAHQEEPEVEGGILDSYRRLSKGLLQALKILNINANADKEYNLPAGSQKNGPVCFEVPSNYEITVDGKKLIGSAQARRQEGVLQHGSLPLYGDLTRILKVLSIANEENRKINSEKLRNRATTVEAVLKRLISWQEAANAIIAGFSTALGLEFFPGELSPNEMARAGQLVVEKYANPAWIKRL